MNQDLDVLLHAAQHAFDGVGAISFLRIHDAKTQWSFFPRKDSAGVYCRIDTGDIKIKLQLQDDINEANAERVLAYMMTKAMAIINGIMPLIEEER